MWQWILALRFEILLAVFVATLGCLAGLAFCLYRLSRRVAALARRTENQAAAIFQMAASEVQQAGAIAAIEKQIADERSPPILLQSGDGLAPGEAKQQLQCLLEGIRATLGED